MSAHNDYKIFNDSVHGTIKLGPLLVKIIDTPEFQRLRHIKQLGGAYFVYPGAQHNRFEHSIGTTHLAGKLIRHLNETQPELRINSQDILCVEIAGLCHDLGHGPFSHLFDGGFLPRCDVKQEHEKVSCDMFDRIMVSMPPEYQLSDTDRICIKEMIDGPSGSGKWPYNGRGPQKGFLFEIISNKKSGVDVDKWDYFARDCHHLGFANGFDHDRFIEFTRVIKDGNEWRICVRDKEVFNLYEKFHTRFALHKRAYQHKAVNAIEHMICDALVKANSIMIRGHDNKRSKMSECVMKKNLGSFCNLDDRILQTIEHSEEKDLEPARKILKRISTGDHYRCVGNKIFRSFEKTPETKLKKEIEEFTTEERNRLEKEIEGEIEELLPETSSFTRKIKVSIIAFDYGMKHEDPIKYCLFYSKTNPDVAKKIKREDVSTLLPSVFIEFWIQVFCTKISLMREELQKVEEAFEKWYEKHTITANSSPDSAVVQL